MAEAAAVLGSRTAVDIMIAAAQVPTSAPGQGRRRVGETAIHILAAMEATRATWQIWHVRAEAERQVRTVDLPAEQSAALVALPVSEVIDHHSIALTAPPDGIEEPAELRRTDWSSVYTVAGADRYTSRRILDAEQRLLAAAGQHDGTVVDTSSVDLALLELAANGTELDHGQAALVREMCMSGARTQLAIAPAGAGKTTAMRASPWLGLRTAARSSASPRRRPRPPSSPNRPASTPTPWPNSFGHSKTGSCRTGPPPSDRRR